MYGDMKQRVYSFKRRGGNSLSACGIPGIRFIRLYICSWLRLTTYHTGAGEGLSRVLSPAYEVKHACMGGVRESLPGP